MVRTAFNTHPKQPLCCQHMLWTDGCLPLMLLCRHSAGSEFTWRAMYSIAQLSCVSVLFKTIRKFGNVPPQADTLLARWSSEAPR